MPEETILVVDDEETLRRSLEKMLSRSGYIVHTAGGPEEAEQVLGSIRVDLAILDLKMPNWTGELSPTAGIALLKKAKEIQPEIVVIMLTAYATVQTAVEALKLGAFDYVVKGQIDSKSFLAKVKEALHAHEADSTEVGQAAGGHEETQGPSPGIRSWLKERVPGITDEIIASVLLSALLFVFGKLIGVLQGGLATWFKSAPSFLYLILASALVVTLIGAYVFRQKRR
jgi:DNA-binding NtrC family response regulator